LIFLKSKRTIIDNFDCLRLMDKKDGLVLLGIVTCGAAAVSLMVLTANGLIANPFLDV
jgi:hypothetical protein